MKFSCRVLLQHEPFHVFHPQNHKKKTISNFLTPNKSHWKPPQDTYIKGRKNKVYLSLLHDIIFKGLLSRDF